MNHERHPLPADVVLSPHAETMLMEVEDAVLLGNGAQREELERVEREFEAGDLSYDERRYMFALLQHPNGIREA
jgi:hypothetical protein